MNFIYRINLFARIGVLATALLVILFGITIWPRAQLLKNGTQIILNAFPVNPRYSLRGQYVQLHNNISEVSLDEEIDAIRRSKLSVFVVIAPDKDGIWQFERLYLDRAQIPQGKVFIAGKEKGRKQDQVGGVTRLLIEYGIEQFSTSLAKAKAIETRLISAKAKEVQIIARVSNTGKALISGIIIDGKKVYEETIF